MSINKNTLPTEVAAKSILTLVGAKTITSAFAYRHGTVEVIELGFSDTSTNYIKVYNSGQLEIGGTLELGSGTKVTW